MPFALLLALAAVAGATLLTYLYDRDALVWARLCAGVCVGFAALGLVGFVLASWLGMTPAALALADLVAGSPLLLLLRGDVRTRAAADAREGVKVLTRGVSRPGRGATGALIFYAAAAVLFWFVCDRTMYANEHGVFTGVDTNIGDLPFHLAVITGFAHGENFPPEHPEFAGVKLTYPFVVDFVTAMFVRAGASLPGALFWQNYAMMLALAGLLHRWAWRLTRDRAAALVTPSLVLLSGGLGWLVFLKQAVADGRGVFAMLGRLDQDYTIMRHHGIAWGNAVTALFVPQRGILLGVGLALLVWTLWWEATEEKAEGGRQKAEGEPFGRDKPGRGEKKGTRHKAAARASAARAQDKPTAGQESPAAFCLPPSAFRQMLAAGLVAGLLPLVHAHSFVVMMAMGGCLALLQGALAPGGGWDETTTRARLWEVWRPWAAFFAAALVLAVPQMWWATHGSAVQSGRFFGWELGWDNGEENAVWFWLKNTGVFIPLLLAALVWRGRLTPARLFYFYLPFTLCFVVPNLFKLSPWVWDNIKILLYWWIASAPLVALVLAWLWRRGKAYRLASAALLFALTAAGALDVWRAASGAVERQTFDADGLRFAELVKSRTPPRSLILHAPTYNDPVYLTGRRTFLGYPGHIWSHGLDYADREAELRRIYSGGAQAEELLAKNGIEYVVVGPLEEAEMRKALEEAGMRKAGVRLNRSFFERYEKVGEAGEYRLYKTARP
ncbi:MAG TPA: hypothetical protein VG148_03730 [Pyrinomonadaceae bacterium]|nr:hypothetical protein [Pyrinomonadaceae bacterium]